MAKPPDDTPFAIVAENQHTILCKFDVSPELAQMGTEVIKARYVEPVRVLMNRAVWIFGGAIVLVGAIAGAVVMLPKFNGKESAFVLVAAVLALGSIAFALKPVIVKVLEKALNSAG